MMQITKILKYNHSNINKVINLLRTNNLVALPSETVYGLAGNAYSNLAVKQIYEVKNRPYSSPLIVHFKNINSAINAIEIDSRVEKLANKFWPGPLTLVAKIKNKSISNLICSKANTVAVRVPSNEIFLNVLNHLDFPLAAPSANRFGKITPTNALDVKDELNGKIKAILDGGNSQIGLESTVVDVSTKKTSILRLGGIEERNIKKVLKINFKANSQHSKSPGLSKYHYQPNTPLKINVSKPRKSEAFLAFGKLPKNFSGPSLSLSKDKCLIETAKNFYKMLRILDKKKSSFIAVQKIPNIGLGITINERLKKASVRKSINSNINNLKLKLDKNIWSDNEKEIEKYLIEPRGRFKGQAKLLLKPRNTLEVAKIVKLCNRLKLPIVPQGGRTGLTGGTSPSKKGNEVLLSLEKMNKIISVDSSNFLMTVQAGCILSDIKIASEKKNCFFPLKLASEGSCTIGGNIATNAGGSTVLKYGMTRELVSGLEVVLPNGDIISNLSALKKDNRAYDLKNLFIGAEGTLGIVTAATIKLFPQIKDNAFSIVAVKNIGNAIRLLSCVNKCYRENLATYELNSYLGLELIQKHFRSIKLPFDNLYPWYVIIELTSSKNENLDEKMNVLLEESLRKKIILDAIQPLNLKQKNEIWKTREFLSNAQKLEGPSIKHDISIPLSNIPLFLKKAENSISKYIEKKYILAFGHLADGNLHYNIGKPKKIKDSEFRLMSEKINNIVFDLVQKMGGSFSAEHGIGKLKIKELKRYSTKEELNLKKSIKLLLDPRKIMNPGKIFR